MSLDGRRRAGAERAWIFLRAESRPPAESAASSRAPGLTDHNAAARSVLFSQCMEQRGWKH